MGSSRSGPGDSLWLYSFRIVEVDSQDQDQSVILETDDIYAATVAWDELCCRRPSVWMLMLNEGRIIKRKAACDKEGNAYPWYRDVRHYEPVDLSGYERPKGTKRRWK